MTERGRERLPVLLLPGWNGFPRELRRLARFLVHDGWHHDHVHVLGFRSIWGSNIAHADEVSAAIDELLRRTRAPRVDVIAFSMSGLAVRWHLAHARQPAIRRVVFIATPHRGTLLAHIGWGPGAREMRPGSEFLRKLESLDMPADVRAHTVRTVLETRVFPGSNAKLHCAASDHLVRFATHPGMLRNREVFRIVRDCLL